MSKRKIWSIYWPPGFATLIIFLLVSIVAIALKTVIVVYIAFVILAAICEIWQAQRRKKANKAGEKIADMLPLARVSVAFALIGIALFAIMIWMFINMYPDAVMEESWTWLAFHGILWDIGIISVVTIGISIITIIRSVMRKKYGVEWAIYSIILAVVTLWMWITLLIPLVFGVNEHIRDTLEKVRLEKIMRIKGK